MARWSHLLTETVSFQQRTGTDLYGDPTYGPTKTIKAAVQNGFSQVRDSDGLERTSSVMIVSSEKIGEGARVWLPDDDASDASASRLVLTVADDMQRRSGGARIYHTFL